MSKYHRMRGCSFYMWMWGKNKHWAISAGWGWIWCVWGDSEKVHWNWAWVSNRETRGRCIQTGDSWKQIMSSFVGRGGETFHVLTRSCEPVGQGHPDHCISPFPLPWACSPRLLFSKCCQSFLSVLHNVVFGGEGVTFKSQETVYIKKQNKTKQETQNCDLFWKNSKDLVMLQCVL